MRMFETEIWQDDIIAEKQKKQATGFESERRVSK